MANPLDLVVLGTGSAAATVAMRCRRAGWSVAVIDSRPFGGTCALRGCDPKKVLVGAAEAVDWTHRLKGKGVRTAGVKIDWPALMRFKNSFTQPYPKKREKSFAEAGIRMFHGRAQFIGPTEVAVGDTVLAARHIVIATGAKPAELTFPGAGLLTTSDAFLDLKRLPRRILFVGGGYISFEFAHVAARAGAQVTILHRGKRPLVRFDADLVAQLVAHTRNLGVAVELETEVEAIERTQKGFRVHARSNGKQKTFRAELVVHGAGRVPEIDDLNLAAAEVERDARGIRVDEYLQSVSNPAVYAAGDAASTGAPPLTPVAGYEGRIVAANLLEGNRTAVNYPPIPSVVFTLPPLASVGLHEHAAREQGLRFRIQHQDTHGWYSSRRIGESCSGFKVLVEEGNERILGAHLLGPHAEETINLFALAMRAGVTAAELRQNLFAYPTHASDVQYML